MQQQDVKKIDDNTLQVTTTETKVEEIDIGKVIRDRTALAERIDAQITELQAMDAQIALAKQAGIGVAVTDASPVLTFTKVDPATEAAVAVTP